MVVTYEERASLDFDLEAVLLGQDVYPSTPPQIIAASRVDDVSTIGNDTHTGREPSVAQNDLYAPSVPQRPDASPPSGNTKVVETFTTTNDEEDFVVSVPTHESAETEAKSERRPRSVRVYCFALVCCPVLLGLICGLSFGLVWLREDSQSKSSIYEPSTPSPNTPPDTSGGTNPPSEPPMEPTLEPSATTGPTHSTTSPPTTLRDTNSPTATPSASPTPKTPTETTPPPSTSSPTNTPTRAPTKSPTATPTEAPSPAPTPDPTAAPSPIPTLGGDIAYPSARFVEWSVTNTTIRQFAMDLGYTQWTWNNMGENGLERLSFETIQGTQSSATQRALVGLALNKASWDCWINHYYGYDWAELEQQNMDEIFRTLGWTPSSWSNRSPDSFPSPTSKRWVDLTASERFAAESICYRLELWDGISLRLWDDIEQAQRDFIQMLVDKSFDLVLPIVDEGWSPQHRAFTWLTSDTRYWEYSVERRWQRWVLALFAFGLSDEELTGDDVERPAILSDWVQDTHECTWFSARPDDVCSSNGDYQRLDLRDQDLYGTLPTELSLLSNSLEWIFLRNNNIDGIIPSQFGELALLERLQVTGNRIEGTIPGDLGRLPNLSLLGLGRNHLAVTIPTELANLQNLVILGLERNSLTGTLPRLLRKLENLEELYLDGNMLTGTIPALYRQMTSLERLNLSNNDIVGTVPASVCSLPAIEVVSVDCDEVRCTCCDSCPL